MTPKKTSATVTTKKRTPRKPRAVKAVSPKTEPLEAKARPIQHAKSVSLTRYTYAVGRRKSAVARVRIHHKGDTGIIINGKPLNLYFPMEQLQTIVQEPLVLTGLGHGAVSIKVQGGGIRSQAESIRHGIARALLRIEPNVRIPLKRAGFLTRDSRVKERKKYGLKRARRAPQWQKR